MAKEQSPYEGLLDNLGGKVSLGQVISVDAVNRTVRVKTLGNAEHGTDDQDLPNVKILHMQWSPDGTYAVAMPQIGTYYIVGYLNSEPVLLGAYPLSNTFGGGAQANQTDDLAPGDYAFVTAAGSRLIIRSGGTVEIESTKNCRTYWLPIQDTITTVCQNKEMSAGPGYENWTVDPNTDATTVTQKVFDNLSVSTAVQTQIGTTVAGPVFDFQVGPVDDSLNIVAPTMQMQVAADGTTTVNVAQGKVTVTIAPDGTLKIATASDATFNVGGKATVNATGDVDVTAGGDCNVTASGKITETAPLIILNKQGSGVTTFNSHLGVIDEIVGTPCQPSTTVFADI
jgi:hypothetical protein